MKKRLFLLIAVVGLFLLGACDKTNYKITGPTETTVEVGKSTVLEFTIEPETEASKLKASVEHPNIAEATLDGTTLTIKGLLEGTTSVNLKLSKKEHKITVTVVKEAAYEEKTIAEILNTGKNNDRVTVTGVVYGITTNESGFYLEDSDTGKIFVTLKEDKDLKLGDQIKLEAEYGLIAGYPRLKNAVVVEEIGQEEAFGSPVNTKTIAEVLAFDKDEKIGTYANIFFLTGTIVKTSAGYYQLKDEEGKYLQFTEFSNVSLFEDKENGRFEIKVILHDFSTVENRWRISFVGSEEDIVDSPITLEEIMPYIINHINETPKVVQGNLSLSQVHPTLSFVNYEWSVEANPYLTIAENEATFDLEALKLETAEDLAINLKVLVSSGDESQEIEYPITIKAIKEQTLSALLENEPEVNYSYVIVSGRVLAFARNQSLSIRSFIIEDPVTKETTTVDFDQVGEYILNTSAEFLAVKVGDDIVIHAQYRNISRESLMNVTDIEVVSSGNEVAHDYENAYVLKDEASYEELGLNYSAYVNKLVKIENPYLAFSTSTVPTQTNWVRIFHDETPQVYDKSVNKKYFAFLIAAQSENLGNDQWTDWFDIPFVSGPAVASEVSFYAYLLYPSDTYLQFVIPSMDEILFGLSDRIDNLLQGQLPTTIEPGETVDLNTHADIVDGGIVWTIDVPLINLDTGLVGEVEEETKVTLTATFSDGDEEVTLHYEITILLPITHTVQNLLQIAENGQILRTQGHVVGYFSDGNDNGIRGIILKDKVTSDIVFINDASDILGSYGNSQVDEQLVEIGDELSIRGLFNIYGTPERKEFIINASSELEIISKGNELIWPEEDMIVITNQEEMVAFFENPIIGKTIKFIGTEENPFGFGGSTNNPIETMNHKFFYNKDAQSNDEVKYPNSDGKVVTFKNEHNRPNAGAKWWVDLFELPDNSFVGPTASMPPILREGVFYGVLSAETGTYYQMNFVNVENFVGREKSIEELVSKELTNLLPDRIDEEETLVLPQNIEGLVDAFIWTIDVPLINLETGLVANVEDTTLITLTATFSHDDVEKSVEFTITIMPKVLLLQSVSEIIAGATDGTIVRVKGVVAGFHWNGSSTRGDNTHGIILTDKTGNDILYVTGLHSTFGDELGTFIVDEHVIAVGDEIEFISLYNIGTDAGFEGRKQLTITTIEEAGMTLVSSDEAIAWDLTKAETIASNADLSLVAESLEYGKLYKLTGAFGFRASASSYGTGVNFVPGYAFTAPADFNHTVTWETSRPQRFSIRFDGNALHLGNAWWETALDVTEENYGGTASDGHLYAEDSYIYFIIGSALPRAASANGYIQLSVLDLSWINVTRI